MLKAKNCLPPEIFHTYFLLKLVSDNAPWKRTTEGIKARTDKSIDEIDHHWDKACEILKTQLVANSNIYKFAMRLKDPERDRRIKRRKDNEKASLKSEISRLLLEVARRILEPVELSVYCAYDFANKKTDIFEVLEERDIDFDESIKMRDQAARKMKAEIGHTVKHPALEPAQIINLNATFIEKASDNSREKPLVTDRRPRKLRQPVLYSHVTNDGRRQIGWHIR